MDRIDKWADKAGRSETVAPIALVGAGEAFHFPGQVALYYQEFPKSLRSTSTAMIALLMGIGYYLGTAIVDLFRRVTDWVPNDINNGRLDNVFWVLVVVCAINLGYFLNCATCYKYKNFENTDEGGL
ncbi:hypothetical protein Sjap_013147 [Stephania japonica]|uniref:Uncharacterized protein n=1 Tax=Stephania japonica TaxID=461633 RepID=A0AAP0IY60_9MAGN